MPERFRAVLRLLFVFAAVTSQGLAQRPDARLTGTVVDKSSGALLPNTQIVQLGGGRTVTSDSLGRYDFSGLPSGIVRLMVRHPGFPSTPISVALARGETMERVIELDSTAAGQSTAQPLPSVTVPAPPPVAPRFADFERRRKTGRGQYLTLEDIEQGRYNSLQDAMRNLRGVTVDCGGGVGCHIRMVNAPMQCNPDYVVDERVDNAFGPSVPIRDIEAIEVYTGAADVPGEFAGRNAGCGVVVIWTKAGPPRRKKP